MEIQGRGLNMTDELKPKIKSILPKSGALFYFDKDDLSSGTTTYIKNMDVVEIGSFILSCMEQIPIEQQRAILISCLEVIFRKASDLSEPDGNIPTSNKE